MDSSRVREVIILLTGVTAGLLFRDGIQAQTSAPQTLKDVEAGTVRARRIELVDDLGHVRGVWSVERLGNQFGRPDPAAGQTSGGEPQLSLLDEKDRATVLLSARQAGGTLSLTDKNATRVVTASGEKP